MKRITKCFVAHSRQEQKEKACNLRSEVRVVPMFFPTQIGLRFIGHFGRSKKQAPAIVPFSLVHHQAKEISTLFNGKRERDEQDSASPALGAGSANDAGNYTFGDFVRIGAPFALIVMIVCVLMVPWLLRL